MTSRPAPTKVCVVTSFPAAAEPRAPRHALAIQRAFPEAKVVFIDTGTASKPDTFQLPQPEGNAIARVTRLIPTRDTSIVGAALRKARSKLAQLQYRLTGVISESLFGPSGQGLFKTLEKIPADLILAHNIDTLLPAAKAARAHGAVLMFDCMEYYSDMGDDQSATEARAAHALEKRHLPSCALVLASSDSLARSLQSEYKISLPIAAYNVPPRQADLPPRMRGGLNLYWRNRVLGLGQRGLEDALIALTLLPPEVKLFLQGHLAVDNGRSLVERIAALGLSDRVTILPPHAPGEAVAQAARFDIGLCLERKGPRNHDLTVSNKMFDYHMAGLAVVSSNLPALASVISESKGGLLYEQGNPASLAAQVQSLYSSPDTLATLQENARRFAMETANLESTTDVIIAAIKAATLAAPSRISTSNSMRSDVLTFFLRLIPWSLRSQIKKVPGVAELQRFLVSSLLTGRSFVHRVDNGPAKGLLFEVHLPEDKGIWTGTYEAQLAAEIAAQIKPGDTAFDIGGWHGFFSGVMAAHGAASVHVFEPLPENARTIRRLLELNPDKPIVLHECAVGDVNAETDLYVMPETSMAKIAETRFQVDRTSENMIRIPVRSIDSMIDAGEVPPPALIKLDVEGAENLVFRGARRTLSRYHPIIFAEIHSEELLSECSALLEGLGYQIENLHKRIAEGDGSTFHIVAKARADR